LLPAYYGKVASGYIDNIYPREVFNKVQSSEKLDKRVRHPCLIE
jgi:hypothetical protein